MSTARDLKLPALLVLGALGLAAPSAFAAEEEAPPKGAAVTVFKAAKSCFGNNVEDPGSIIAREETQVRPERMGLKVAEVLIDAGDSVTAGQTRPADAAGRRHRAGAGPGRRNRFGLDGRGRRHGLGQGRGAVLDHRPQRIRPGPAAADPRYRQTSDQPDRADQGDRRRRGRWPGAAAVDHGRAQQPARAGLHRRHHQPAAFGQFLRAGADQDRPELRHLGAADRDPLWQRPVPWCRW